MADADDPPGLYSIGALGPMRRAWIPVIAAKILIPVAVVSIVVHRNRQAEEYPGFSRVVNMVQEFRAELEATAAETPPNADHLRAALARIDNERDKWQERSTEAAVLGMQAQLRERLNALERAR